MCCFATQCVIYARFRLLWINSSTSPSNVTLTVQGLSNRCTEEYFLRSLPTKAQQRFEQKRASGWLLVKIAPQRSQFRSYVWTISIYLLSMNKIKDILTENGIQNTLRNLIKRNTKIMQTRLMDKSNRHWIISARQGIYRRLHIVLSDKELG